MPDISKLTMSNGVVYNIKDSQARKEIEDIKKNGSAGSGGSGGGVLVVTATIAEDGAKNGVTKAVNPSVLIADKTVAEIREAMLSGGAVFKIPSFIEGVPEDVLSVVCVSRGKDWGIYANAGGVQRTFHANSLSDYPQTRGSAS